MVNDFNDFNMLGLCIVATINNLKKHNLIRGIANVQMC